MDHTIPSFRCRGQPVPLAGAVPGRLADRDYFGPARVDFDLVHDLCDYRDRVGCRPVLRTDEDAAAVAAIAADCCRQVAPFLRALRPEEAESLLVTREFLRPFRHRSCHYVTLEHRSSRCPVVLIRLDRDTGQHPRKAL